ncbi:MAG TPA: hypothetical protein VHV49_14095 [Pseudonocardiaceae bacterium]|nr:hypothetical protein [Pseudonocardiaceae bacterium]
MIHGGVGTRLHLAATARSRVPPANGYWFPMLVFGVLIMLAPLVYQSSGPAAVSYVWDPEIGSAPRISGIAFAPLQQFGTCDSQLGDPMSVALYWFCVVMFGPLLSTLWLRRRARRDGSTPQTGWHLLFATTTLALYVVLFPIIEFASVHLLGESPALGTGTVRQLQMVDASAFLLGLIVAAGAVLPLRSGLRLTGRRWLVAGLGLVLAITSAAMLEFLSYLSPKASYGALLIIAIGLLALAVVERCVVCTTVAVAFTVAALVASVTGFRGAERWLGIGHGHWSSLATAFGDLAVPGAILLVGGVIGACAVAARRV